MKLRDASVTCVDSIDDLRVDVVRERLREVGVVTYDTAPVSPERFATFVDQLMADDPLASRLGFALGTRESLGGLAAHGLHSEFCVAPCIMPQFIAFYCVESARYGGRTILADGVELLANLTDKTRQFFLNNRLRFRIVLPFSTWKIMFGTHLAVLEFSSHYEDLDCWFGIDGVLNIECVMNAIQRTSAGVEAFVNPLLHASDYPRQYGLSLQNGSSIPVEIATEVRSAADRIVNGVAWKQGMLLILDNTRILHGRERVLDAARKSFVRQMLPRPPRTSSREH